MNVKCLVGFFVFSFFSPDSLQATEKIEYKFQKDSSISNNACTSCHQQFQHDWEKSDHSKAMAIADKSSVLSDFNNQSVEHYGQKAYFLLKTNDIKSPFLMKIKSILTLLIPIK